MQSPCLKLTLLTQAQECLLQAQPLLPAALSLMDLQECSPGGAGLHTFLNALKALRLAGM